MRILIAYYNYPQLSATYVEAEIQYLLRQGVEVEVWSETTPGSAYEPSCKVHKGSLSEAEEKFRPDIVHIYWLKMAEKLWPEISCDIITARSHSYVPEVDVAHSLHSNPRIKTIFLFPEQASRAESLSKIVVLPVAYDATLFSNNIEIQKNKKLVICTTAGLPAKAIEVFYQTALHCPEIQFILVVATCTGHSDLIKEYKHLNKESYPNVDVRIDVPHSEIPPLLAEASTYLCTQKETKRGMPIAIAEALASGCFVLVPDFPWLTKMVGPFGSGYSDAKYAANQVLHTQSWEANKWNEFSKGASEFAKECYGDEAVLPAMVDNWKLLISRR